jgi:SAM-dependent methyltransferase
VTLPAGYFDRMYDRAADPWGMTTRWYERRKYAVTLALLPAERYQEAFEPGCSVGVLSERLAARCDRLLCCDTAAAAVQATAVRTAALPQVTVQHRDILTDWPAGQFDLIVLSELLYYFAGADLDQVTSQAAAALRPGGCLAAVHWRHPVADYPRGGDEVHARLARQPGLALLAGHREPDFLAEVYLKTDRPPVSVAQAGGLV